MQIEIEKKFEIIPEDIAIIKDNCEFIEEVKNTDYYLDTDEYILIKNSYHFRMRNWKYELKIASYDPDTHLDSNKEFDDEDEINKQLEKFQITTDDVEAKVWIETTRTRYRYTYKDYEVSFDIDDYKIWSRYEIELLLDDDIWVDWNQVIEDIREHLWLTAPISLHGGKMINAAMHQNIELYEILAEIQS